MVIFTDSLTFDLIALTVTLVIVLLTYLKWKQNYWDRIGLQTLPTSILFGNCKDIFFGRQSISEQFSTFYKQFKAKNLRHAGIYMVQNPLYMPLDPEIIKHIMQKDFQYFVNHAFYINEENDPLTGHLFGLEDAKWKNMRAKLTPTFTSGKMKMMFHTMADCAKSLKDILHESESGPIEIKEILACFTTDVIASCAFGIECNTLRNPNSEFRRYGKRINENTLFEAIYLILQVVFPPKFLDLIKYKQTKPDVEEFIMRIVRDTVEYRETNQIYRKDFMHLLLQLKNRGFVTDDEKLIDNGSIQHKLTLNEIAAQCFVFYVAGFETSSTTMAFALYEISLNAEIQEQLRQEIDTVLGKYNNELCYEAIMEMTYMDKVIYETLRKYPPLALLGRRCSKDYTVPGTDITLKKDTGVIISVLALHRDPEYYPDPERFDPERFSEKAKSQRPNFTYLPFGEGPRICIGMRFGLMQTKIGLTTVLKNFKIALNPKTQVPLQLDKTSMMTVPLGGIWLDIKSI